MTPQEYDAEHDAALLERERDDARAEADRFYKALTRIYQSGKGRHVEIARAALDGEEVDR